MNPPDDQEFGLSLDLLPVTNDGTAIGKSNLQINEAILNNRVV